MAVVPAGVHLVSVLAGVRKGVELLHRQRVHVSAQANSFARRARFDNAHHARHTHAAMDRNTPFSQLVGHYVGCAHLFKTQLRVSVDVAANGGDAGCLGDDGIDNFHKNLLISIV